jgi:hypothetical protein
MTHLSTTLPATSVIVANPDRYARLGHQTFSLLSGLILARITGLKLLQPRYMYFSEKWNHYIDWSQSRLTTATVGSSLQLLQIGNSHADAYGNTKWDFRDVRNIRTCLSIISQYRQRRLISLPFDQLPGCLLTFLSTSQLKSDLRLVFQFFHSSIPRPYTAVHIRRGDVSSTSIPNKYVHDDFYLSLLRDIILSGSSSGTIHIVTQGDTRWLDQIQSFASHNNHNIYINQKLTPHCDDEEVNAFYTLFNATTIFTAGSAFSELAALLGRATRIYNVTRAQSSSNLYASLINPDADLSLLPGLLA